MRRVGHQHQHDYHHHHHIVKSIIIIVFGRRDAHYEQSFEATRNTG